MAPCQVCCEPFNKSNHARVKCPFCEFDVCTSCAERYICETTQDAHCMSCRNGWTRETLVDNFTQKFVSQTYKARRENLLCEREKSLMPATQVYVEIEKEIRSLSKHIAELKAVVVSETQKYNKISNINLAVLAVEHDLPSEFRASILRHKMLADQLKIIHTINDDIGHLEWTQNVFMNHLHGGNVEQEKRQFVRACPAADCKGFLSTAWKCGLCDNWTCPECHEVKGPNKDAPHTCDPNNVATAQLLARDSRGCPKCAAMIFKINGCDQMYCTQCHTAFSWRTGRIEMGVIHNPHYYEYRRAHGGMPRNPFDIPCGGFPQWSTITQEISTKDSRFQTIANAHMAYGHMGWVIERYRVNMNADNRDLRIKLMIGDFGEDEFKRKIQQREKARQRKTDIFHVIEMLRTVLTDLFQEFGQKKSIDILDTSLKELKNHYNDTLDKVSFRYGKCAVPKLRDNFYAI